MCGALRIWSKPCRRISVSVDLRFRPLQVLVKEAERPLSVDRMRTVEEFDLSRIGELELCFVEMTHLGEFQRHAFIGSDPIKVAPLDHEWSRGDERSHLGVVERAAEIELEDLILVRPHVAVRGTR